MAYLEWSDELSVSVRELDEQHQQLMRLLNELHAAARRNSDGAVMADILEGLVEYASTHFRTEETYMTRFGFPGYRQHETEHERFIGRLLDFQKRFSSGAVVASTEVMNFLKDWLMRHILGTDRKYSSFFNDKGLR